MKIYSIIRLVILTAVAVLIGVFSHHLVEHYLQYLVGGVMIYLGLECILIPLVEHKRKGLLEYQFYLGHVNLLLGLVMVTAIKELELVCVIWGTWTIVRESFDLYETGHKAAHGFPAIFSFALSIVEIVFSILLILFASEHHALTHVFLLVPELILYALSPLVFELYKEHILHKQEKEEK